MEDYEKPFIVFKFLNNDGTEPDEEEDVFYDVGLAKWIITDINDKMIAKIKWPLCNASSFVRKESKQNSPWSEQCIKVKRFYSTYLDAADSCKKYIADSNYETDNRLGKGMRKKRKPVHLDSESSDKESEPEVDLKSNVKRKKIVKKCSDKNILTKTSNTRTAIKSLPSPPVPPLFLERFLVSPDKITRDNTFQYSKLPTFSLSVDKGFNRNHANFIKTIISQNNEENEEKKKEALKKLRQGKENKQKFKEAKKHKLEKEFSSCTFTKPILEKQGKDDVKDSCNSILQTSSKNISTDMTKSSSTDMVLSSVSDKVDIPTDLHTVSPVHSCISYQLTRDNLLANQEHEESSHIPSVSEIIDNQSMSVEDQCINSNEGELYLQKLLSLKNMICKGLNETKKEICILSSKMDICLMNQEKLNRCLLPGEKVIKKPSNFPSLPVNTELQLNCLENFLKDDGNLSAASIYFAKYVHSGSLDNSVRRILSKIMTNTLALNYSFQGRGNKKKLETLKIWDLVQGALMQTFDGECLIAAEKVASSWLANAKWRQQSDGTLRQKPPKSNN